LKSSKRIHLLIRDLETIEFIDSRITLQNINLLLYEEVIKIKRLFEESLLESSIKLDVKFQESGLQMSNFFMNKLLTKDQELEKLQDLIEAMNGELVEMQGALQEEIDLQNKNFEDTLEASRAELKLKDSELQSSYAYIDSVLAELALLRQITIDNTLSSASSASVSSRVDTSIITSGHTSVSRQDVMLSRENVLVVDCEPAEGTSGTDEMFPPSFPSPRPQNHDYAGDEYELLSLLNTKDTKILELERINEKLLSMIEAMETDLSYKTTLYDLRESTSSQNKNDKDIGTGVVVDEAEVNYSYEARMLPVLSPEQSKKV